MKPPLQFNAPPLYRRIGSLIFIVFLFCFFSFVFCLPLIHIARELKEGNIPWPLIAFSILTTGFSIFMMWICFKGRHVIFPYQFTIDSSQEYCGYLWRDKWVGRISLRDLKSIVCSPAPTKRRWPWNIYAEFQNNQKRKLILISDKSFSCEIDAYNDCLKTCRQIASYLEVPITFNEWSDELINHLSQKNRTIE